MAHGTCIVDGCDRLGKSVGRCKLHYQQWYRSAGFRPQIRGQSQILPIEERLARFTDKNGPNGCWIWTGAKTRGYAHMRVKGQSTRVARLVYTMTKGRIPPGLTIDHLCMVIACVNPDHLEAVTNRENKRRATAARTSCPNGHPYTEATTHWYRGWRTCRICHRLNEAKRRARSEAA